MMIREDQGVYRIKGPDAPQGGARQTCAFFSRFIASTEQIENEMFE